MRKVLFNSWDPKNDLYAFAQCEYGSINNIVGKDEKQIAHETRDNKECVSVWWEVVSYLD